MHIKYLFILSLSFTALNGCVWIDNTDDLSRYISEVRERPSRPIKPLPEFVAYEAFVYEGDRLRNPFIPVVQIEEAADSDDIEPGNTPPPDNQRLKSYLEQFPLDSFSMVGNVSKTGSKNWVLIVDSNGEIHRVTVGDFIGLDHGKVTSVSAQAIKIIETISNGRGGWITRPRIIELAESEDS